MTQNIEFEDLFQIYDFGTKFRQQLLEMKPFKLEELYAALMFAPSGEENGLVSDLFTNLLSILVEEIPDDY